MNQSAKEFYLMALVDISNGNPKKRMEEVLKYYEELEQYEACQGIKKAIDETWN